MEVFLWWGKRPLALPLLVGTFASETSTRLPSALAVLLLFGGTRGLYGSCFRGSGHEV